MAAHTPSEAVGVEVMEAQSLGEGVGVCEVVEADGTWAAGCVVGSQVVTHHLSQYHLSVLLYKFLINTITLVSIKTKCCSSIFYSPTK